MSKIVIDNQDQLIEDIANGDEQAFAVLYKTYAKELIPFFSRFTKDESAASDLLQNTFLSIWLDRVKLPEIENLNSFIYKVAANRAYTWLTKQRATKRQEAAAANSTQQAEDITSQEVLFREAKSIVNQAIQALPSQRRKIFELYKEGGLKYDEIAERLNITPSTARNAVAAALESIRQKLTASGLAIFFILFFASR